MTTLGGPAGPRGHRLLGSLPELKHDRTGFLQHCAREFGDVVPLRFGPRRALLVNHPDLIGDVLVDRSAIFAKPYILRTDQLRVGDGRLGQEGDAWRRQRLAQPAFHRHRLPGYGEIMVAATRRMLDTWNDGETRDIQSEMMRLTLEIVAETLFGVDVAAEAAEIGNSLRSVMDGFVLRLGTGFLVPEWLPTPSNRRLRRSLRRLDAAIDGIVDRGRARGGSHDDLLAHLLTAADEGRISRQEVREQATTFFLAGHETTALSLTWTWYLLAMHPAVETQLIEEVQTVLGGQPPVPEDAARLPYVAQIVNESLRLYPPIWAMARIALQDAELGGQPLRAGTIIIISPWVMQRDPRFFVEPDRFAPERWADDLARQLPQYAYFPFGGGPRGCIGSRFALQEAILLLATIAQQYRLTLIPGVPVVPQPSITLRAERGMPMLLRQRPPNTATSAIDQVKEQPQPLVPGAV